MRIIFIISFLLSFVLVNSLAAAQVQYYGVDTTIDDNGRAMVSMTITFVKPEPTFNFTLLGKIENLRYSSLGNSINCTVESTGLSTILCNLDLTEEKRSIELSFDTNDIVKPLDKRFFYSTDFSINTKISQVYVSVRLPEGMGLVNDTSSVAKLSFPANATILSDGRRIIVIWNLKGTEPEIQLRFQLLYENIGEVFPLLIRFRYVAVIVAAAAAGLGFVWFRYFRGEPQKLVLSVLDQFERKIMDVLVTNGGTTDQRKIVQDTNLSKAKVSRVIKSLSERGLVEVERHGRSNKIKIVKKKFKL
ncbi:MAG: winged helix-turn-helix transcriptional regulator [Candidatus Aenigmarchaeota archaeon]|nr:winged helix-turn-helix transcriptional regulator [Candidatus Aenigmarchaeota archaeon]